MSRSLRTRLVKRTMRSLFCPLAVLLLVACSSTSLTSINGGSDPTWMGEEQYEVLVAIRLYNRELRVMFEQKWSKH
jgi:outer membrane biogenesis lipoprotein LolB